MKPNKLTKSKGNIFFFLFIVMQAFSSPPVYSHSGQTIYSPHQWCEDIEYMVTRLEIMHPNLYASISKEKFQGYTRNLLERASHFNDNEMIIGINELLAHLKSLHTFCLPIVFTSGIEELKQQYRYYPVQFHPFKDGLFITAASAQYAKIVGMKVTGFGPLPADEVFNRLGRFTAADNDITLLDHIPRYYMNDGPMLHFIGASEHSDRLTLHLIGSDGTVHDYEIETVPEIERALTYPFASSTPNLIAMNRESANPIPLYLRQPRDNYWFEYLPEYRTVYLQINILTHKENELFDLFCNRMFRFYDEKQARRLVIDLRLNGGGNHIELPLIKGILNRPDLDQPGCLAVIIGRTTVSAAQHLTSELKWYTRAVFFGEPTCSKPNQYGAIRWINLPHSKLRIGCAVDYYQDAQPFDFSMQTDPDIYITLCSSDVKDNADPVLEAALRYNKYQSMRPEFTEKLSHAYRQGKLEGLTQMYRQIKQDYVCLGFNLENLLYQDLAPWMSENSNKDEYLAYLQFIYGEIPNSLDIEYELGLLMIPRDREEAKQHFERCLEINPEHHYAQMKLDLIQLEEEK